MAHHHEMRIKARKRLTVTTFLTALLAIVEFIGGFLSNSLSLMSDAGHMVTDLFAMVLILFSIHWATKTPSKQMTYGYYRIEILATLVNGAFLLFIAFEIIWRAIHRFIHPSLVQVHIMLPIASFGLFVNLIAAFLLHKQHEHLATRSAYYHVLSDTLSSIGVVVAAIIFSLTGWKTIDPLASLLIAGLILFGGYRLLREAIDVLLEASPLHIPLDTVRKVILEVKGVEDVHDLHVWTISSGFHAASAHLLIYPMDIRSSEMIVQQVSGKLKNKFSITHTTMQIESLPAPAQIQKVDS